MKLFKLFIVIFLYAFTANASKTVIVNASESDAKIFVDGKDLGTGSLKVTIPKETCVTVKIQKSGFLPSEQTYCNKKGLTAPPKSQYFILKKDDAIEASNKTDQANVDFAIKVNEKYNSKDAWKLITQIITDYFDAIELSDQETSYLRTAWTVQTFTQNTIRSRAIVKLGNTSPFTIKVKLVSEFSGEPGTSPKSDEKFREWDRVLRKYQNLINDFQTRLSSQ
jgi:hypothetical protein